MPSSAGFMASVAKIHLLHGRAFWVLGLIRQRGSLYCVGMSELFEICCERDPVPSHQRQQLLRLLKSGADVHATDKNGVTALHHAVRFRSPVAVQTLIEHGANVNQPCRRHGSTPLHRAVTQTGAPGTAGRGGAALTIVKLLLAAGADPSITNKLGKRPYDYAIDDALRALLAKPPDPPTERLYC